MKVNFLGSRAPFGYKRIKLQGQKGFSLEVIPEQAEIVRLIYDMYNNGHIPREIATTLDNMNVKPLKGGKDGCWSEHSLRDILSNPVYLGKIRWKDRKVVKKVKDGILVSTQPKNKKDDLILVEGLHEAIITEEQFQKAEQIRKAKCFAPLPSCFNMQNPLAGIVYCAKCGRSMRRVLGTNKEPILACTNKNCNNISSNLDIVEQKLFTTISSLFITYENEIKYESIEFKNNNEDMIKLKQKELDGIKLEIEQAQLQLDNIQTLLEKGVYDLDTYSNRSQKIFTLLDDLKTKYSNTNNYISEMLHKTSSKKNLIPKLETFLREYEKLDVEQKNKLLKTILIRVDYLKETKCYGKNVSKDNFKLSVTPKF